MYHVIEKNNPAMFCFFVMNDSGRPFYLSTAETDRARQCVLARKKCAEMGDYGGFDRASSDLASVNEVC